MLFNTTSSLQNFAEELYPTIVLIEHISLETIYVDLALEILVLRARQDQSLDLIKNLYSLFASHFNAHQLFLRRLSIRKTSAEIWTRCVTEAFQWCHNRDYFCLWAYLPINWYRPTESHKWARAANDEKLVLKIIIILESRWCRVRYSYLHECNKPQIDLVAYIILSRLIPDTHDKLQILLSKDLRRGTMSCLATCFQAAVAKA